ncbi:MAG: hypothetical protein UHY68_03185 [Acutalibacteraceae bacterium]|nr:hypothetical protein [Acutalibacteraceae bacterium]
MKKIISLMLAVICMMSLILSGCDKQEIEPVTVGELLDLIKAEGYTDIQHEEGTYNDYLLIDSGNSVHEDTDDIRIALNGFNLDDVVTYVRIEYNFFNEEVECLLKTIAYKLCNDNEFVEDIILASKTEEYKIIEKGDFRFDIFTFSEEYVEEYKGEGYHTDKYRKITLSIDINE